MMVHDVLIPMLIVMSIGGAWGLRRARLRDEARLREVYDEARRENDASDSEG